MGSRAQIDETVCPRGAGEQGLFHCIVCLLNQLGCPFFHRDPPVVGDSFYAQGEGIRRRCSRRRRKKIGVRTLHLLTDP